MSPRLRHAVLLALLPLGGLGLGMAAESAAQVRPGANGAARQEPYQIFADEITYDQELGLVTATGHVEISQIDRILIADSVSYNQRSDVIVASGNVSLLEPSGEVLFGDYVELTGDLREGTVKNFRLLLQDRSRFVAAFGRRTDGNQTILRRAVYSPCDLCRTDPQQPPLWQLKADRIEHDQEKHQIYYKDASLEMFGVPVFYTPYLEHPDPTVKRRSGFLVPIVGSSDTIGQSLTIPYYFALAPDYDLTVEPMFTTNVGVVLGGEYRQRFQNGRLDLNASATYTDKRDDNNNRLPGQELRGHVRGTGRFDIDDSWRWGFDLARATDDTYLARYKLLSRYGFPSTTTLTSRSFLENFDGRSYGAGELYAFQGLRIGDDNGLAPLVLPLLQYNYVGEPGLYGGHLSFDVSGLSIVRSEGTDTRRISVRGGWTLPYTAPAGDIYTVSAMLQGDIYNVALGTRSDGPLDATESGTFARIVPALGFNWRYPFVRNGDGYQQYIEPMVTAVVSPNSTGNRNIPNEDSRSFDLDYTNLFSMNRFGGIDRVESGPRLVYGVQTGITDDAGRNVSVFAGQSWQSNADSALEKQSGLRKGTSDVVGRLTVQPYRYASAGYAFRADTESGRLVRSLATYSVGPPALRLDGAYLFIDKDAQPEFGEDIDQLYTRLSTRLTENWRFEIENLRSFNEDSGDLRWSANVLYGDECFIGGIFLQRRFVGSRDNPPDTSIVFRLVFRNLGEFSPRLF